MFTDGIESCEPCITSNNYNSNFLNWVQRMIIFILLNEHYNI